MAALRPLATDSIAAGAARRAAGRESLQPRSRGPSVVFVLVFGIAESNCAQATAQEGGTAGAAPAQSTAHDAGFQQRVDAAVDARLRELGLVDGAAHAGEGAPALSLAGHGIPFDLSAGAWLWHYEPLIDGVKNSTELYNAYLTLDADAGPVGFHFEGRYRDTKLRPFFPSNVWVQEAYARFELPWDAGTLKAGKEYTRFGWFWDGSFFGNQPYFDGLKLDPMFGVSLEDTRAAGSALEVEYALQFFPVDARTNGSLQDRDTLSVAGARKRNMVVARVAPEIALADGIAAGIGLSGQQYDADFAPGTRDDLVRRGALDVHVDAGPLSWFGEYAVQRGRSVVDFPFAGMASDDVRYFWSGVDWRFEQVTLRFAWSMAVYDDQDVRESTWLPGLTWSVNRHVAVLVEYDAWRRQQPGSDVSLDRSLNVILWIHF